MKSSILIICIFFVLSLLEPIDAQSFNHPGLLHNQEDLDRMRKGVAEKLEPIYQGFEVFRENLQSQATYTIRGPKASIDDSGWGPYYSDADAAYQCALMWCLTGDIAYANKAREIINSWSSVLKTITGYGAVLGGGLGPFKMVNAAEILRYTNASWSDDEIKNSELHFKEVVYPVLKDFALYANGNWDAAAIKTIMAIGIFCNDRSIFERGLCYYVNGWGNGRLTHYVINEDGQIQESGRDQGHSQLGIGLLAECCEIAWHQGLDLYAYANNRLLKGFEYTAKYNLGNDVPFTTTLDRTGKYPHKEISSAGRGKLRPIYEQIYNHYVNRMGVIAPFTKLAAEKNRPEKKAATGADHPGYGTLFYSISPMKEKDRVLKTVPSQPGAIIAKGSHEIDLTWVASVNATNYTLKRAAKMGGPYSIIAKNISKPYYTDVKVKPGKLYYYTVSASNETGESPNAFETAICAGLPSPWKNQDVGKVAVAGGASYDGRVFTIEGAGTDIGGKNDQFQFFYKPMKGDGSIIARFVPQISSQSSKMGLMMRETLTDNAIHVSAFIQKGTSGRVEVSGWRACLVSRDSTGGETILHKEGPTLTDPVVTNGRLTGYYWLKLERTANNFTFFVSTDGFTWEEQGSITVSLKKYLFIGVAASSNLTTVTTTVMTDNINASK